MSLLPGMSMSKWQPRLFFSQDGRFALSPSKLGEFELQLLPSSQRSQQEDKPRLNLKVDDLLGYEFGKTNPSLQHVLAMRIS